MTDPFSPSGLPTRPLTGGDDVGPFHIVAVTILEEAGGQSLRVLATRPRAGGPTPELSATVLVPIEARLDLPPDLALRRAHWAVIQALRRLSTHPEGEAAA